MLLRSAACLLSIILGSAVVATPALLLAIDELAIVDTTATGLAPFDVLVEGSFDAALSGYTLAVAYDPSHLSLIEQSVGGTAAADAEGVFGNIFDIQGGAILGVILDFDAPFDGQTLPPSPDSRVPLLRYSFQVSSPASDGVVTLVEFQDGVLGAPPVDNEYRLADGSTVGVPQGLSLVSGNVTIDFQVSDVLAIEDFVIPAGTVGEAPILLTNSLGEVEAFRLELLHPAELQLESVTLAGTVTEFVGAESVLATILPDRGILEVTLDVEPPFLGQTIPVAADVPIATFVYSCPGAPLLPKPPAQHTLSFERVGTILTVSGLQITPQLQSGVATCEATVPVPPPNTIFACGQGTDEGEVLDLFVAPGSESSLGFYYSDPDDALSGFSLAIGFSDELEFVEGTFSVAGTVLESVGAEFVSASYDNDSGDGDGREFTAGVLLDALPPFDGQVLPLTTLPLAVAHVAVIASAAATVGSSLEVEFVDGVNGTETVPVQTVAVIGPLSVVGFERRGCVIRVVSAESFRRGDCNRDGTVGLTDVIRVLAVTFGLGGTVSDFGSCPEACNFNGAGAIGLVDAVYLLNYLYADGPTPPAPFTSCAPLATELGCSAFEACP